MNFKDIAGSIFFPVTELLSYAVTGFLVGLAVIALGWVGAAVVMVVSIAITRPANRLRFGLAQTWGLQVRVPTPAEAVLIPTVGILLFIVSAETTGLRIDPVTIFGITAAMFVISLGLTVWFRMRARRIR